MTIDIASLALCSLVLGIAVRTGWLLVDVVTIAVTRALHARKRAEQVKQMEAAFAQIGSLGASVSGPGMPYNDAWDAVGKPNKGMN